MLLFMQGGDGCSTMVVQITAFSIGVIIFTVVIGVVVVVVVVFITVVIIAEVPLQLPAKIDRCW